MNPGMPIAAAEIGAIGFTGVASALYGDDQSRSREFSVAARGRPAFHRIWPGQYGHAH